MAKRASARRVIKNRKTAVPQLTEQPAKNTRTELDVPAPVRKKAVRRPASRTAPPAVTDTVSAQEGPAVKAQVKPAVSVPDNSLKPLPKKPKTESGAERRRQLEARAYQIQAEEEERERARIAEEARRVEEEQQRLRAQAEARRKAAAEEKKRREEEEARIAAEVERRLKEAQEEALPQVIMSPKAKKAKRATVFSIVAGVILVVVISLVMGVRYDHMRQERDEARQDLEWYRSLVSGEVSEEVETSAGDRPDGVSTNVISGDGIRRVYLTFDDGPSEVTDEILDILDRYHVKATFFVLGREDADSLARYKRIVEEGHTLAMHSYDHNFTRLYDSLDSFSADTLRLRNFLYEATDGEVWSHYYRFPGGSSTTTARADMQELIDYLDREGIVYFDWNVYGGDDIAAEVIVSNVTGNIARYDNAVVLMHDAADKQETVEALPQIIEYIQAMDHTVLLPITDETTPVQHGKAP